MGRKCDFWINMTVNRVCIIILIAIKILIPSVFKSNLGLMTQRHWWFDFQWRISDFWRILCYIRVFSRKLNDDASLRTDFPMTHRNLRHSNDAWKHWVSIFWAVWLSLSKQSTKINHTKVEIIKFCATFL